MKRKIKKQGKIKKYTQIIVICLIALIFISCKKSNNGSSQGSNNLWGLGNSHKVEINNSYNDKVPEASKDSYTYYTSEEFQSFIIDQMNGKVSSIYDNNYQELAFDQVQLLKQQKVYTFENPLFIMNPFGTNTCGLYVYMGNSNEKVGINYTISIDDKKVADFNESMFFNYENKIIEGTVQRITNFGAFVDLGGVDGLIHISDLSWHRVKHPSEVVNPGDKVEVQVLSFDKEKNRISLGLKQTIEEPWVVFSNSVNIGDVVEGEIVNLVDFGAFVRLESGVDGLLHVSQISNEHINKPSDVLKLGEIVKAKIMDIKEDERRISLSIKEIEKKEEPLKEEEKVDIPKEDMNVTIEDVIKEDK